MTTIQEWQEAAHGLAREKGWYDGAVITREAILSRLMLVCSEIAEAAEEVRSEPDLGQLGASYVRGMNPKPEGFGIELADAVIRIMDLCEWVGVDLQSAIEEKHSYNQLRPRMHGKHA